MIRKILFFAILPIFITSCACGRSRDKAVDAQTETTTDSISTVSQIKPAVNFYIENSGSMDGYVKGVTEFEQAIYSYLSDIKISGIL